MRDSTNAIFYAAYRKNIPAIDRILDANPQAIDSRCVVHAPTSRQTATKVAWLFLGPAGAIAAASSFPLTALAGVTTLMIAALTWGDLSSVLLDKDREDWTPLHFAALSKSLETTLHLINRGADETLKDKKGRTYLDLAPSEAFKQVCRDAVKMRNDLLAAQNRPRELQEELERTNTRVAQLVEQINNDKDQLNNLNQQLGQFKYVANDDMGGRFFYMPPQEEKKEEYAEENAQQPQPGH